MTDYSTKISNSYATGTVTSTSLYVGGLVGFAHESTIENSYWDKETTGKTSSDKQNKSFGKTTVEMMKQATYTDWNFVDVWKIDEGNDYPKLR